MALDVVVIGGGILGLATAYRLLEADPGLSVALVEKERRVAEHQTGRNSGVLHSGLYYRPGSARARLCTSGKREMERYTSEAGIPVLPLGKVVVAVDDSEMPRLHELLERGRANGLEGLELLGPDELCEREPHVAGVGALLVPGTSVTDFRRVADRLAEDVRARGGQLVLGSEARSVRRAGQEMVVETPAGGLSARVVVACAGLQADRVAASMGLRASDRVVPFRGTYRAMREGGEGLVRGLVYPVPEPGLPFLGVHFTPQVDGSVLIGPNAVLAAAREGASRLSFSPRDLASALGHPGVWRLARRQLRSGLAEAWRDVSDRDFLRACRRYVPELERSHLGPATFGTRAQLLGRDGTLVDDFVIREAPGRVVVLNAPSPAATASLAIGETIAERVREQLR
ncbi:MAG TPA: L-2-hydroxyglutarate oxidase [Actinomycetota bacterium]